MMMIPGFDDVRGGVGCVACGHGYTMAVAEEGALWSWGCGAGGRLGHNDICDRLVRHGWGDAAGAVRRRQDCHGRLRPLPVYRGSDMTFYKNITIYLRIPTNAVYWSACMFWFG
jgi:hypothetical protein